LGQLELALPDGESAMFQASNRNKKGIGVDIQHPTGRDVFHRLIEKPMSFLTNIRKSTKAKLKIDYASLCSVNPTLIHANVSGYGPRWPHERSGGL
jgi:crotonobetainyl-CoA:carnitine CoA-transferase CaiB-like acyl-CoA transferase